LSKLISKREALNRQIKQIEDKIKYTRKYLRLLFSKDKLLLKISTDALRFLGIDDVEEKGGADEEDLIFHFRHVSEFDFAVIEVHGTENNTSLSKLRMSMMRVNSGARR
jgi:hypothetical protein